MITDTQAPTVSVIVPSLDEAQNLALVVPALPAHYEVIVVEGARFHRTSTLLASTRPDARIVEQTRYGKGNALACGFAAATGDIIVMLDADGSADPGEIPQLIQPLLDGADLAKGTRARLVGGGSDDITQLRSAGNVGLTLLANVLYGTRYSDLCYGLMAFRRHVLDVLALPDPGLPGSAAEWGDGFEIETLIVARISRAKLQVVEVPSHEHTRIHGVSNLNAWRDGRRVLATLLRERFAPTPASVPVKELQ